MVLERLKRFAQGHRPGKAEAGPHWRTPALLDRGGLGEACLALDGQGHGSALWERDGEIWTMPIGPRSAQALMRLPMGAGATPRMALNPEGRGIAVWQADLGEERQILGRILGGGESIAQMVFRTPGRVQHLQPTVDRRGDALVVWLHEREGQLEVMAQGFDTRAATWEQAPTSLGSPSAADVAPRFASNRRGHAMVLWGVERGGFEGLVASHYWPTDRIWSDRPVPVVSHGTRHHQVVMDDLGNALAVWIHAPYGERCQLEASYYDAQACEWREPELLASAQILSSPRLEMTGEGEALAAWCQEEGFGASRLLVKAFKGGRWNLATDCLELGQDPVQDFAVALGSGGRAGLLAVQRGAEGDWVSARLRLDDWSVATPLMGPSWLPCAQPRLAFCPQGVAALWTQGLGRERALFLTESH